jgi:hypothetical protein
MPRDSNALILITGALTTTYTQPNHFRNEYANLSILYRSGHELQQI